MALRVDDDVRWHVGAQLISLNSITYLGPLPLVIMLKANLAGMGQGLRSTLPLLAFIGNGGLHFDAIDGFDADYFHFTLLIEEV